MNSKTLKQNSFKFSYTFRLVLLSLIKFKIPYLDYPIVNHYKKLSNRSIHDTRDLPLNPRLNSSLSI
jgi:hypothetical protein